MMSSARQNNESIQTGAIFFSGQYGSTAQYAEWIGEATGLPVFNVNETNADPANYDFLVFGSSVIVHKLLIRKWVKRHLTDIEHKPVILCTVSGARQGRNSTIGSPPAFPTTLSPGRITSHSAASLITTRSVGGSSLF